MDAQTSRVGIEILQAGANALREDLPASWEALNRGLLDLARCLTSISMESASATTLVISPPMGVPVTVRDSAVKEMHRCAADAAQAGGEVAMMALVLCGDAPSAAQVEITRQLRDGFTGEKALARNDGDHLLAAADRDYVLASSYFVSLAEGPEEGVLLAFIESVLGSVGAVVQAAAGVRMGEARWW